MLDIDKTIKKIITALSFISLTTKNYTIEDLLNIDLGDINAIYKSSRINDTPIAQKSYAFLTDLFRNYGGRTLFDVLKNMYGKEAYVYDTNLQVEAMKEIRELEALERIQQAALQESLVSTPECNASPAAKASCHLALQAHSILLCQ